MRLRLGRDRQKMRVTIVVGKPYEEGRLVAYHTITR